MRNLLTTIFCILFSLAASAQELNATVTVNSSELPQGDLPVFRTLERSLNDFVNKNKWTNRVFKENERINAQMIITLSNYESNRFDGNIVIQSSRPVFNTSYETPVFNYKDGQFSFQYIEFEPLVYNENNYSSNLVGVIAYYVYVILGMDANTFSLEGGSEYFEEAQKVVTQAQGTNFRGWSNTGKDRNRFELIDDLLSNTYREYHVAMYNYHRKGLDILGDNNSTGKQVIQGTMNLFATMQKRRPNAFLTQIFFETKSDEIASIFSDGPKVDVVKLKEILNKVAPYFSSTWNNIKY